MLGIDSPLWLALLAFAAQGTSDFRLKAAVVRKGDPFSLMAMTVPTFALTSAASGLILGSLRFSAATLEFGALIGTLSFISFNLFVSSLKEGEASVNTMLFRLSFVVTSLLSIALLGESTGWAKWLGLALAAGAVCSAALDSRRYARQGSRRAILFAAAALVCYGFNGFFFKIATLRGAEAPGISVVTTCTFGVLSVLVHLLPWGSLRFRISPMIVRHGLFIGFLQAVAFNAILWSMGLGGEASVVIPILQLSFLLTAALAILSLKEPFHARKQLGFLLGILALVLLAL